MKSLCLIILACTILAGCKVPSVPCQPGWKIITNTDAEAANLRQVTGNDLAHTGRVVEITTPTAIQGTR